VFDGGVDWEGTFIDPQGPNLLTDLPPAQAAWIPYDGGSVPEFGSGSESPMGGPVYRYDPELDSPVKFPEAYDGDFFAAWGGIASLEIGPALVWTQASRRGFSVENLARWMSAAPAALAGLAARKGAIAPGRDADLVLFDPDAIWRVEGARLHHRHALTPYEGMALRGVARRAFLRGELVYDNGAFAAPRGELLAR